MSLLKQLTRWKIRGQIDQDVIDIILTLQSRLEHHWRIDVSIPIVITLLLHIANSLARLKRGGCVSPLHQPFYDEMQSAVIFPDVLEIHHDLLSFIPQEIPEAEQSYYLANIYSLLLEQDKK